MKKQILNLGKALNKAEQKQINGGGLPPPPGLPGGSGGVSGTAECLDSNLKVYAVIPCDTFCPDGARPFCYA